MADLGWTFNTEDLPDAQDFSPVPAGKYTAMITNSKLMPTKKTKEAMQIGGFSDYEVYRKSYPKADGYLALEFDIQDNGAQGRKIFHNLNLLNESQQAADIAAGQLKQILQAFGMKTFSGKSEELHNKRLVIDVKVEQGKPYTDKNGIQKDGNMQNKVTKFSPVGAAASAPAAAVQATGTARGPWGK